MRNSSFTPFGQEVNVVTVGDDKSDTLYSLTIANLMMMIHFVIYDEKRCYMLSN